MKYRFSHKGRGHNNADRVSRREMRRNWSEPRAPYLNADATISPTIATVSVHFSA